MSLQDAGSIPAISTTSHGLVLLFPSRLRSAEATPLSWQRAFPAAVLWTEAGKNPEGYARCTGWFYAAPGKAASAMPKERAGLRHPSSNAQVPEGCVKPQSWF